MITYYYAVEGRGLTIDFSAMTNANYNYSFNRFVNVIEDAVVTYAETILSDILGYELPDTRRIGMTGQLEGDLIQTLEHSGAEFFKVSSGSGSDKDLVSRIRQDRVSCGVFGKGRSCRLDRPYDLDGPLSSGGERPIQKGNLPAVPSPEGAPSASIRYALICSISFELQRSSYYPSSFLIENIIYRRRCQGARYTGSIYGARYTRETLQTYQISRFQNNIEPQK